jgi:hypothetical protein
MILPTKHIRGDRALIGVGGEILQLLEKPMTVSGLWDEVREVRGAYAPSSPISYEWFVLALDLLFIIGAVYLDRGVLHRTAARSTESTALFRLSNL